jgi:hypothetical protein
MSMGIFITIEIKKFGGHLEDLGARMSEPFMPKSCSDGGVQAVKGQNEGVQVAGGVTSVEDPSRGQILDGKTKRVKFN